MRHLLYMTLIFSILISACQAISTKDESVSSSTNGANNVPITPAAASSGERSPAYLDDVQLITMESYPLQFMLSLKGSLPTPCHQIQIAANPPDAENKIMIEVYSVADPDQMCMQVLAPFEINHPLGSFPAGRYSVWINGEQVLDFDA